VKRRQFIIHAALGVAAWSLGCAAAEVSPKWEALLQHDPFGTTIRPEPPPPEPTAQLELRGVMVEGGKYWFSVYDVATKKEAWVQKDDRIATVQVKDFDETRDQLTLESAGHRFSLALKQTKLIALPAISPNASAFAATGGAPAPAAAVSRPPTSEIRRLEQVAVEIRQRREQRIRKTETAVVTKA
jgi:hypothetical protein